MIEPPKVSVSLITYNHARYIETAIKSVLGQETDFPFELIIGEDDSSDGTRDIVRRYADEHPDRIRVHFHTRGLNLSYQGRPTGRLNFVNNLRSAHGQYIALLDGDDYWTDSTKLQRQADFLDANPKCGTCFHRVTTVDADGKETGTTSDLVSGKATYTVADLVGRRFIANTASVMFRRGLFDDFPEWYFRCPVGDFPLHVMNGLRGDFGFLDRVMAAYRIHGGGIWSAAHDQVEGASAEHLRKLRQLRGVVHLYEILSENIAPICATELRDGITFYQYQTAHHLRRIGDWPALREMAWKVLASRPLPREVPLMNLCALLVQAYLPWTAKLADRLRKH